MKNSEIIDMAINMLLQAKASMKAMEEIWGKLELSEEPKFRNSLFAKHCYQMIRGGVGIIELSTQEITSLSHKDINISS